MRNRTYFEVDRLWVALEGGAFELATGHYLVLDGALLQLVQRLQVQLPFGLGLEDLRELVLVLVEVLCVVPLRLLLPKALELRLDDAVL